MGSLWSFFAIISFGIPTYAHSPQEGKVLATVGPVIYQTHSSHSPDPTNDPFLVGIGLLSEGDFDDEGGIEIGLFYIHKTYQRIFGNDLLVEKVHKVVVPVGYRYWFHRRFSGALEFSSAFSVGNPIVVYSTPISGSQATLARTSTEYGLEASLQWELWNKDPLTVLLDGRYYYSITAKADEDANVYGLLVGLKYLIQEK